MGYSIEERQRIFRESQQTLQRVDQVLAGASHQDLVCEPPAEDVLAEALATPLEDRVAKWRAEADAQTARVARFERERRRQERRPAPANLDLKIAEAIAEERRFLFEVLAETVAELAERQREAINDALRPLTTELAQVRAEAAEQKVTICELRLTLSADSGSKAVLDLPPLPLRSRTN